MARIIDRFLFVVFVAIIVVMTVVLLVVAAVKGHRRAEPIKY